MFEVKVHLLVQKQLSREYILLESIFFSKALKNRQLGTG